MTILCASVPISLYYDEPIHVLFRLTLLIDLADSFAIIRMATLAYWAMMSVESHLQRVSNVGVTLFFGAQRSQVTFLATRVTMKNHFSQSYKDWRTQVHGDHLERHIKDLIPEPPVDMRQEIGTTKKDKCPVQEDESSPKNINDTTSKQRVNVVSDSSDRDAC
nr:hypothetical protein Iba_chr15bCG7130 [Ipomoea batatas]